MGAAADENVHCMGKHVLGAEQRGGLCLLGSGGLGRGAGALTRRWCGCVQVTPVVSIVQDFSEGIRLIKLLDHILEVRAPPQRRPLPHAET